MILEHVQLVQPFWHEDSLSHRLAMSGGRVLSDIRSDSWHIPMPADLTLMRGDIRIRLDGIPDSYILTDKSLGKKMYLTLVQFSWILIVCIWVLVRSLLFLGALLYVAVTWNKFE